MKDIRNFSTLAILLVGFLFARTLLADSYTEICQPQLTNVAKTVCNDKGLQPLAQKVNDQLTRTRQSLQNISEAKRLVSSLSVAKSKYYSSCAVLLTAASKGQGDYERCAQIYLIDSEMRLADFSKPVKGELQDNGKQSFYYEKVADMYLADFHECLRNNSEKLDDSISPASDIARATSKVCRQPATGYAEWMFAGSGSPLKVFDVSFDVSGFVNRNMGTDYVLKFVLDGRRSRKNNATPSTPKEKKPNYI